MGCYRFDITNSKDEQEQMNQEFAYETTKQSRTPSPHKGDVWKWIIGPAFFAFFSAWAWGIGAGLMVTAVANGKPAYFIWGCGFFSAGLVGLGTVAFKSWSFDKTDITSSTVTKPVFYTPPEKKLLPTIRGNNPVTAAQSNVAVEHGGQSYQFTRKQLNNAEDRIQNDDYSVARDHLLIETAQYSTVKYIMIGLGYWEVIGKSGKSDVIEWSQEGIDWHHDKMRQPSPRQLG